MIRRSKLPDDILARIQDAADYLEQRNEVEFAYLFGGLAKGAAKPLSDVDIAVYLSEEADQVQAKFEMITDLVDILCTDEIDLLILNQSTLSLCINVLKHHHILVDKKPLARYAYQSLIMRKYFDHHRFESSILRRRYYNG
jgi:hypothetical protein